ncbi:MAG: fumarylacetoacetate hydrolase family protein [Polyangiaceae bacterium]|jgi:fumarylacetoacetate (FAA) hydrolase
MRLATLRDGSRDGALIVVDRSGVRFARPTGVAATLQQALDDWDRCEPRLAEMASALERSAVTSERLDDPKKLAAPLPRAYEWIDGSGYLNHIRLVRGARGADLPPDLETDPLVYQGGSGVLLGPTEPLIWPGAAAGLDFEAEMAVVLGDVPRGVRAGRAAGHLRLLVLANDVTYRGLVADELKKGFGFFVSKPATAFAPFAVTPDEFGTHFRNGRAHLRLQCTRNGILIGDLETGPEMHFSFCDLLAHIAQTRSLTAGTIVGGGTVSNGDATRGVACLAELRSREILATGSPSTPFLCPGDRLRIEAFDADGWSVFGAIEETVAAG